MANKMDPRVDSDRIGASATLQVLVATEPANTEKATTPPATTLLATAPQVDSAEPLADWVVPPLAVEPPPIPQDLTPVIS